MQIDVRVRSVTTTFLRSARAPCIQVSSNILRQSACAWAESFRTMSIKGPLSAGSDAASSSSVILISWKSVIASCP